MRKNHEQGTVFVSGLIICAALLIISSPFVFKLSAQHRSMDKSHKVLAAAHLSEAGVDRAIWELNFGDISTWEGNEDLRTLTISKDELDLGTVEVLVYELESETPSVESRSSVNLSSIMTVGNVTRVGLIGSNYSFMFNFGLFGKDGVEYHGDSEVDSYDSRLGEYDELLDGGEINVGSEGHTGTNSVLDGGITLLNTATVNGNALSGPGSDPYEVIYEGPNANVMGDKQAMPVEKEFLPNIPPTGLPDCGEVNLKIGEKLTISESGQYSDILLGRNSRLTIDADITLYVTGDFLMGNHSSMEIAEGASVRIFLGGKFAQDNRAVMNNPSRDPTDMLLLGTETCTSLDFKNGSDFYGAIYAPEGHVMVDNSSHFYGSLVAEDIVIQSSAGFHFDIALREVNIYNDTGYKGFVVQSWQQTSDNTTEVLEQ